MIRDSSNTATKLYDIIILWTITRLSQTKAQVYVITFESLFRTAIRAKTMKLTKSTFPMLSGLLR